MPFIAVYCWPPLLQDFETPLRFGKMNFGRAWAPATRADTDEWATGGDFIPSSLINCPGHLFMTPQLPSVSSVDTRLIIRRRVSLPQLQNNPRVEEVLPESGKISPPLSECNFVDRCSIAARVSGSFLGCQNQSCLDAGEVKTFE